MDQRDRDLPRSSVSSAAAPVADSAEAVLQLAVDLYGPALLNQPGKLKRQLDEQCPGAATDSALLLSALAEGIPQSLMAVASDGELRRLVPQLEQTLMERRGLNPLGATWAVATWANALRMDSAGLAASLAAVAPGPPDADPDVQRRASIATVVVPPPSEPPPSSAVAPIPDAPVPIASVDAVVPIATMAAEPVVAAAEPVPTAPVTASAPDPIVVEEPAVAEAPPVQEPERVVEPLPVVDALPVVAPTPIVEPVAVAASEAGIEPDAVVADAARSTPSVPLPPWAAPVTRTVRPEGRRRFDRRLGIAGVAVAVVIAIVAFRSFATRTSQAPQAAVVAPSTVPEPKVTAPSDAPKTPVTATTPTASTGVPAVAQPRPAIVAVTSDDPLVGDGQQHDVFVAIDPQRDDVRSIATQFVGGDGTWDAAPHVVDVAPEDARTGRVRVGAVGLRTSTPASATFQYVLTTADGRQSAPFVKQFAFAPVTSRPPVIAYVIAPAGLTVGKPFAAMIDYRIGDAPLASIERKVIDPPAGTEAAVSVIPVDGLASPKPGRLRMLFDAPESPSRSTVELTLIDGDGVRSEPRRIVVDVKASATAAAASVASPTGATGCTREGCGSVVSVRETDATGRAKNYEVIVRMDDRSIRPFTVQGTWKVGRRVRVAGDRIMAANDGGPPPSPTKRALPPGRLLPESAPIVDQ